MQKISMNANSAIKKAGKRVGLRKVVFLPIFRISMQYFVPDLVGKIKTVDCTSFLQEFKSWISCVSEAKLNKDAASYDLSARLLCFR